MAPLSLLLLSFLVISLIPLIQSKSTFIVHLSPSHTSTHSSLINSLPSSSPRPHLIYSYSRSSTGFAARLSKAHVAELRRHPQVLSVVLDRAHQLHTTRTPKFLGLADGLGLWANSDYASDVVVGVVDTGIWPEVPSFDDSGYGPVPATWKGRCLAGPGFPVTSCNRKLIGARAFYEGYEASQGPINETEEAKSPRDTFGHGTHTASTTAGSLVREAGFYEYARGDARGIATKARIAAYKVCWNGGCFDSDILAAMDQAIKDGVHIIQMSLGVDGFAPDYYMDPYAIGAFHAVQSGVLVSCSAGNEGPGPFTAVNVAPWILTVGASTIDREFSADVVLGDGQTFKGVSLYSGDALNKSEYIELVYAGDCGSNLCIEGKLDSSKVSGKMVLCERGANSWEGANPRVEKGYAVKQAGGIGMILANSAESGEELISDSHLLPATLVGQIAGEQIKHYVSSSPNPTATIKFIGTVISSSPSSPSVAAFSGRGPNPITAEILKPDVIAPGVNILAGWAGATSPASMDNDPRRVQFNIMSGTSMASPHVSGLAALLLSAHPSWSPAAIKSALMTTTYNLDNSGKNITDLATGKQSSPFTLGSGHVDPNKALDPGLVYDIDVTDYTAFLCSIGYDSEKISLFLKGTASIDCHAKNLSSPGNLNYPSFSVVFESGKNVVKYTRVVKNVGSSTNATYKVSVNAPPNVDVNVSPRKLVFSSEHQALSYEVTFTGVAIALELIVGSSSFGSIEWSDGSHRVRSPIAVRWVDGTEQHFIASI